MRFGKIKVNTPVSLTHVTPEENNGKIVSSEGQEKAHTSIIPGPK